MALVAASRVRDVSANRRRISSGGPWEASAGYSRAVVVGDTCWVAGTTDAGPDGRSLHPDDIAGQARAVFDIIERALGEAGFRFDEIVRIRMFVTDMARKDELMAVQAERFREIRPAATLVEVSALIDPSLLVEIEADARHA
ncbi:MAG TPA: RidA family protein [Clostridia bacterium]|nr:RidA family protein [Clostridia bacterium]